MRRSLVLVVALAACGDNLWPTGVALAPAPDLTIVAHPDDDLLFMQPDLATVVAGRAGLTSIVVTAGGDLDAAERRYAGLREAYAAGAGVPSTWDCGELTVAGHAVEHCRLAAAHISLVFLGYPDGGKQGERAASLLHLWQGAIPRAAAVAQRPETLGQTDLIEIVGELIATTAPTTIRTLDYAATHGRDHSDHALVGALAVLGAAHAGFGGELLAFRGYDIELEPANVAGPGLERSFDMLAHYEACATGCAACGTACSSLPESHAIWLERRYAVGRRRAGLTGRMRLGDRCLVAADDGAVGLGACAGAPAWTITPAGTLAAGSRCLMTLPSGELVADPSCAPEPARAFVLDDEGHLWTGLPPAPSTVVPGFHAPCVAGDDGVPRARPCGDGDAPTWELDASEPITVPRPSWLPAAGRAVRARGTELCAVVHDRVVCGPAAGTPTTIATLPVEPESLVVMPDGVTACGRTAQGLLCTSPDGPALWSTAFAHDGPATALDRSLAGFPDQVCGLDTAGVICARRSPPAAPELVSAWPPRDSALWPGDLDGDGAIDWCVGTPVGAWCARAADGALSTEGEPWTFSLGGRPGATPSTAELGALTDVDGDGLADLCTIDGDAIVCAHSQRFGFGPPVVIARLPSGGAPRALWMAGPSACVDDGARLRCASAPSARFRAAR